MRFLILSLSLFSFLMMAPASQAAESEKKAKIIEMIKVSGASQMMDETARAMIPNILKQIQAKAPSLTQEHANEIAKVMVDELKGAKGLFFDRLVPVYEKLFTTEEIEYSIEYYKSPLGQSIIKKMPQLLQGSMRIGQSWATEVGQQVAETAVKRASELGYKL